ncbi:hypothetical protein AB0F17_21085 [Nonomuraea sp. NPDC026600]|uniref:hypothetical protein n=1 Tax=Nonomuraea sp. NPDC026600 TaxID=3155363 RepID=UPI00340DB205
MLIEVLTGGDTLRQERLARMLLGELSETDHVTAKFLPPQEISGDGQKSGAAAQLTILATVAATARPAAQVLITVIKEWCATERNRKVRVTDGDRSIEITGRPDPGQERLVSRFLDDQRDGEESPS